MGGTFHILWLAMGWFRSWIKWGKSFMPGSNIERVSRTPDIQQTWESQKRKTIRDFNRFWYDMQSYFSRSSGEKCSIPFVITRDTKKQLKDLGFKERHVKKMTPEEAHHIVNNNIRAPPEKKPEAVDLGTIVV